VEDRISGLKGKIDIKENIWKIPEQKPEEQGNMQELCDFIKRPNL
jgi:hypothetical protein